MNKAYQEKSLLSNKDFKEKKVLTVSNRFPVKADDKTKKTEKPHRETGNSPKYDTRDDKENKSSVENSTLDVKDCDSGSAVSATLTTGICSTTGNKQDTSQAKLNASQSKPDAPQSKPDNSKAKPVNTNQALARGRPSSCVFVASLCSSLLDDELCLSVTRHFEQWGKLSTVKVLRDTSNRPYAFVQYGNDEDCKRAIKFGHNSVLNGRNLRCEHAKVNRTLFICCPTVLNEEGIKLFLETYGEIEQVAISTINGTLSHKRSAEENSSRFWYAKFAYRDDAIRAYANLTEGDIYRVEWAQNIDADTQAVNEEYEAVSKFDKFSIFVGQLAHSIQEKDLYERFSRHGKIEHMELICKPTNVFAFIKFEEESSAASSVERENHTMLCGKTMHVQYREIHSYSSKGPLERSRGLALAPPPINLSKRQVSGNYKKFDRRFPNSGGRSDGYRRVNQLGMIPSDERGIHQGHKKIFFSKGQAPKVKPDESKEGAVLCGSESPTTMDGDVSLGSEKSGSAEDAIDKKEFNYHGLQGSGHLAPFFYYFPGPSPEGGPMGPFAPPTGGAGHNFFYPPFFVPYDEMAGQPFAAFPMYFPTE